MGQIPEFPGKPLSQRRWEVVQRWSCLLTELHLTLPLAVRAVFKLLLHSPFGRVGRGSGRRGLLVLERTFVASKPDRPSPRLGSTLPWESEN